MIKDAFWTHDYSSGVTALIGCLAHSQLENNHFLAVVNSHVDTQQKFAETIAHATHRDHLKSVTSPSETISSQSTLQFGLSVFAADFARQAAAHARLSARLREEIRDPIANWFAEYRTSVEDRKVALRQLVSKYQKLVRTATKCKAAYYESSRKSEDARVGGSPRDSIIKTFRDLREKFNANDDAEALAGHERQHSVGSTTSSQTGKSFGSSNARRGAKVVEVAGLEYTRRELSELLANILSELNLVEYKVPFLHSYHNVATGSMIATSARKHLKNDSYAYAEKFGQSLVNLEYLKPVGQLSNRYQSSHDSNYQITQKYFELTEYTSSASSSSSDEPVEQSSTPRTPPMLSGGDTSALSTSSVASKPAPDNTEGSYIQAVVELDVYRCSMEVEITEIYESLEQLERDRYLVIKKGLLNMLFMIDGTSKMKSAHAGIDADRDLQVMVSRYETGPFVPNVMIFQSYYGHELVQTFGVDLQYSKFFPEIVLNWLEKRRDAHSDIRAWCKRAPLNEIYVLRTQVNTGKTFNADTVFRFFSTEIVISTFLQYFLELPESLIPFTVYETFSKLFNSETEPDVQRIAKIIAQIPHENQEVLFRLLVFVRTLFHEEEYAELGSSLALFLMRPRAPSALSMHDKHPPRLIEILLCRGTEIFASVADSNQARDDSKRRLLTPATSKRSERPLHSPSSFPSLSPTSNTKLRPLSLTMTPASESEQSPKNVTGLGLNSILPLSMHSTPKTRENSMTSAGSPVRKRFSHLPTLDLTLEKQV